LIQDRLGGLPGREDRATMLLPPHTGLSAAEAAQRLKTEGPNELPRARRRTLWRIVLEAARDPMSQFLLAGVTIYLLLGDVHEALLLGLFVLVTIGLSVVQQQRTERVLEALQDLASPRALVLRGGERVRIPGREVVRGDLLLIGEGDRVAADGVLLSAHALETDESLLTGESVPVRKVAEQDVASARARMGEGSRPGPGSGAASGAASAAVPTTVSPAASAQPGGDGQPFVWAGSVVVKGQGIAQVTATGAASAMGRIGQALRTIDTPDTPLTVQTRRLVRLAAVGGAGASLLFVLAFGLTRGDWLAALLGGVTLAMSLLPEEFSLILTVFMAMGAWRLSHQRVLARRPAAIEALGAATVLCTDKTGTLTWNRMAVTDLAVPDFALSDCGMPGSTPADPAKPAAAHPLAQEQPALQVWTADEAGLATPLPEAFHALLEAAVLASQPEPFDPMERAFHALGQEHLGPDHGHEGWELVHAWGLTPELLAMSHAWRAPGQDTPVISAKGAPEAIALLCRLSPAQAAVWREAAQQFTARGKRVLAVARAVATAQSAQTVQNGSTAQTALSTEAGAPWPATPHSFEFQPLGLVALADPLRPEVPAAVAECRRAGVRVAMVTGDHPGTALAIATEAGIDTAGGVLTGADIEAMDEAALRERALRTSVFARVMPQQKLKLVQALKAGGEVVAMTGDGVNDAPALKAAHIGIAMGRRGTDVAREAASLVLLEDDFGAIVKGLRMGRRILDNVRKGMVFVLAVHVPIAGLALLPLLLGWPPLFTPVHIAFLELVIDPVCAIVFEAEGDEDDVMARPPRDPAAPIVSAALVRLGLWQGAAALGAVGALYVGLWQAGVDSAQVRAAVFTALVTAVGALVLANRSFSAGLWTHLNRPNRALWAVLGGTSLLLLCALEVPALQAVFSFAALAPLQAVLAVGVGLALLPLLGLLARRQPVLRA
jgi:Ca2+-transporting ATPase